MGFRVGARAKVWKLEDKGNFHLCQMSTSHKGLDGKYKKDYSGFVRLYADAHEKAKFLQEEDTVKLVDIDVTTNIVGGRNYTNCCVYDMELSKERKADQKRAEKEELRKEKERIRAEELIVFDVNELPFS